MDQQIPQDIIDISTSAALFDKAEAIGNKFNLHINQVGELDAEVRDILRGVSKPEDFTDHLIERLEIDKETANKIVEEVNKEVFQTIKMLLQSKTQAPQASANPTPVSKPPINLIRKEISSIEQAGNFSLEKESHQNNGNVTNPGTPDQILSTIEDKKTVNTEPLVDHLLANPVAQVNQQPVKTLPSEQKPATPPADSTPKPPTAPPRSKDDPYLDPII